MLFTNTIPCAEISRLSTVTCRLNNEEVLAIQAVFDKHKSPERETRSALPPDVLEKIKKEREQIAKLPYCGRVKYSVPTSLVLVPEKVKEAPDLFQTAEWFGAGAQAFHLILASERFVNLVRDRRWKGLVFNRVRQSGWSERRSFGLGDPQ